MALVAIFPLKRERKLGGQVFLKLSVLNLERSCLVCEVFRLQDTLEILIKKDAYKHQKELPNNFERTITPASLARKAVEMFKDEYLLDFINDEEIGERDAADVDERVVENAIIHNVKNFIMTFGKDFAFVGDQYHLEAFNEEFFSDLLFFNRELNCLVVVELKRGEFKPAYLGQLSAYLRIVDDKIRKPHNWNCSV